MEDEDDTGTEQDGAQSGAASAKEMMAGAQTPGADDGFKAEIIDELGYDPFDDEAAEPAAGEEKSSEEDEDGLTKEDLKVAGESKEDEEEQEEESDEDESKEEKDSESDEDLKGLPEDVQARINKRIGKSVRKQREAEERAEAAEAEKQDLQERLDALEQDSAETQAGVAASRLGVSEVFLAETEAKIDAYERRLEQVEDFCETHKDDGYEGTGTEDDPSFTAAEIRARLRQVQRELRRDVPRARELLTKQQARDAAAKKLYPELGDSKSDVSLELRRMKRMLPGLRMLPGAALLVADMLAGRKAREAAAKAPGKNGKKRAAAGKPKPQQPTAGKTAGPRSVDRGKPKGKTIDDKFAEGEYSDEALAAAFED